MNPSLTHYSDWYWQWSVTVRLASCGNLSWSCSWGLSYSCRLPSWVPFSLACRKRSLSWCAFNSMGYWKLQLSYPYTSSFSSWQPTNSHPESAQTSCSQWLTADLHSSAWTAGLRSTPICDPSPRNYLIVSYRQACLLVNSWSYWAWPCFPLTVWSLYPQTQPHLREFWILSVSASLSVRGSYLEACWVGLFSSCLQGCFYSNYCSDYPNP